MYPLYVAETAQSWIDIKVNIEVVYRGASQDFVYVQNGVSVPSPFQREELE